MTRASKTKQRAKMDMVGSFLLDGCGGAENGGRWQEARLAWGWGLGVVGGRSVVWYSTKKADLPRSFLCLYLLCLHVLSLSLCVH